MRWFLYDEAARTDKALVTKVPLTAVHQVRRLLQSVNPYLSSIRHALQQVPSEATPLAVELRDINTQNLNTVDCRKVVFFRHGGRAQFVHVLSRHYEPLQNPLFFPHGTPGWGVPGLGDASLREGDATATETGARMRMPETCGLSQLQWCRSMLLAEPRFLIFGRLTCEYLVDMYSRIEEMNLDYLRRARSLQSSGFDPATDSLARNHLKGPSYCNRDGRCRFGFPHPLSRRTTFDPQGRIHFRRREEEDAWVVPYMLSLILYMDCHINVDVCLSVNIFMYLFKYLFKGPD
ncbi:hypothetical protein RAB80_014214 [Fusarium oxysporum f. sp. vasinfectum]|nr:hypothetical protein RAB80_014214 [Fusarium oxysporum f. sp. vasinfectum]